MRFRNHTWRSIAPYLATLVLGLAKEVTLDNGVLQDAFHDGEFFATFIHNSSRTLDPIYTIHGSVDWLPAQFASLIMPTHQFFGLTALTYQVLGLVATLIFIRICIIISTESSKVSITATFAGVLGIFAIDHRDLGVLIVLLLISEFWEKTVNRKASIAMAGLVHFSVFWYYTRGLIAFVLLLLYFLFRQRKQLVTFLLSFSIFCLVMPIFSNGFSLPFTFRNVLIIREGSSTWSYNVPLVDDRLHQVVLLIFLSCTVIVLWYALLSRNNRNFDLRIMLFSILLVGFLPISTYRIDSQHALMITWPAFLILVFIIRGTVRVNFFENLIRFVPFLGISYLLGSTMRENGKLFLLIFLALFITFLFSFGTWQARFAPLYLDYLVPILVTLLAAFSFNYSNSIFTQLSSKTDWQRVTPDIRWAALKVKQSKSECLFDFTNQGLIAGLTLLPNCTQYAYPIYAPISDDLKLRSSLHKSKPKLVIISSSYWSYAIDGKSMAYRYPLTAEYLSENYPIKECFKGICVAGLS